MKKGFTKLIILVIILAVVVFFIAALTVKSYAVKNDSMKPTINNGQKIVINKLAYFNSHPKRGDIIVVGVKGKSNIKSLVRRIVGLPGEKVEIKNGSVLVNDVILNEPYLGTAKELDFNQEPLNLSDSQYYALPDNRNLSVYRGKEIPIGTVVPQNFFVILGEYWFSY